MNWKQLFTRLAEAVAVAVVLALLGYLVAVPSLRETVKDLKAGQTDIRADVKAVDNKLDQHLLNSARDRGRR